jgi:hypothetical protein
VTVAGPQFLFRVWPVHANRNYTVQNKERLRGQPAAIARGLVCPPARTRRFPARRAAIAAVVVAVIVVLILLLAGGGGLR